MNPSEHDEARAELSLIVSDRKRDFKHETGLDAEQVRLGNLVNSIDSIRLFEAGTHIDGLAVELSGRTDYEIEVGIWR